MSVSVILDRLERVRKCGAGWIAKCPAHEDRTASLSLCERDGRTLVHCFAGCRAADVLASVGLELADLFEKRDYKNLTYQQKSALRETRRLPDWKAALNVMAHEGMVLRIAAASMRSGRVPSDELQTRMELAHNRITDAMGVLK